MTRVGKIWAEEPFRCKVTIAATEQPVSYADAKAHCRIDDDTEKTWVENAIKSVTELAASFLGGKQIVSATRALYLGAFPCGRMDIPIPYPPLQSVSSIQYIDIDGATQTWSSAEYQVDTVSEPGRVVLHPDYSWPSTKGGILSAVTITFVAGYGAATSVPQCIKDAILTGVSYKYEHRGDDEVRTSETVGALVMEALAPERMLVG